MELFYGELEEIAQVNESDFVFFFWRRRFVFMALMEYCLVNIILGDSDQPKTVNNPPKAEKVFDLAAKVSVASFLSLFHD